MSSIQLKILPRFPAQIVAVPPLYATKSGLIWTFTYSNPSGQISVSQVKQQLNADGNFDTIANVIPGSPVNPSTIAWTGGGMTQKNGPLMALIFANLGYNPSQQAAFLLSAEARTY